MADRVSLFRQAAGLLRGRVPGQLVIQLTDRCNAACPQCGMRATARFDRSCLSMDEVRRMIDAAAEKGVQALSFTGGEPMLRFADLAELIRYAGAAGIPYIRTGTNGFFFMNGHRPDAASRISRIVETLADTPLHNFWISIDSAVADVHESMRGFPGVVEGIEKALPRFHEAGIYPSLNLGINRNISPETLGFAPAAASDPEARLEEFHHRFRNGFRAFYRFAVEMGFTIVNSCYPMSLDAAEEGEGGLSAVYAASAVDPVIRFSRGEKALLFKALLETIPEFRSRIRIFSPRASVYALYRQYDGGADPPPYPCRGGIDFFFVNARDGDTYPCGYRGRENLGKFWDLDPASRRDAPPCTACDWECFRDPSELFGPLLDAASRPRDLIRRVWKDGTWAALWAQDLAYYRACGWFDGRRPPDPETLCRFR